MKPHQFHRSDILADFFLDGAKIVFGSLVVGAFVPGAIGDHSSWLAVGVGILVIFVFLRACSKSNV